jgi:hypothetical protein
MAENKRRFPPSLNAVKSEYKIFCDQYGSPITCDDRFANINFEHCCREFPRRMFEPMIKRWVTDPVHGIRHWPVMAYAGAFRQQEFRKYGAEASPAHVRELLDEIRKSARRLTRALARIQEMSARLSDGTAPLAGPHLSWLDEIIAQAMAGELGADVNEQRLAIVHFARKDFLARLVDVEVAAQHAQKHLDPKLLKRTRTSENRALEPWSRWRSRFGKASLDESLASTKWPASGSPISSPSCRNWPKSPAVPSRPLSRSRRYLRCAPPINEIFCS